MAARDATNWRRLIGALTQRVFLMRNVHDDAPVLLKSRWALVVSARPADAGRDQPTDGAAQDGRQQSTAQVLPRDWRRKLRQLLSAPITATRPPLPAEVEERFVPVRGAADRITYQPRALGVAKLHFVDKPLGI